MKTTKHWLSEDKTSTIGDWPGHVDDETIFTELLGWCGADEQAIRAGTIIVEDER